VFFSQAEDGIRDFHVTGVKTCALPISKQAQSATDRTRQGQQSIAQAGQEMPSQQQAQDSQSPDSPLEQGQAVESSQQADQSGERSEERRVGKEGGGRGCAVGGENNGAE